MDSTSLAFLGAMSYDSFNAEVMAGLMARLYILQAPEWVKTHPIVILYDSQSAADVVMCRCTTKKSESLCKVACAVNRVCQYVFVLNDFHIHSHEGHPWNEYADSICDFMIRKPQEAKVIMTPISPCDAYKAYV